MWKSCILLAWFPAVSRKFCKIHFGIMVSARLNRAIMLSKAQINIYCPSWNTEFSFGKYHLMTELMKGPQTSNTYQLYIKKASYIWSLLSLGRHSFCCSSLLILVICFIPPLHHLTLQDNQSVALIHIFFRKLGMRKADRNGARNSSLS